MRAVFKTQFPTVETEADNDHDELGEVDDDIFQRLSEADESDMQAAVEKTTRRRISCFAHSLQLVVADGLKEARNLSAPLSKASRLSTLPFSALHSSHSALCIRHERTCLRDGSVQSAAKSQNHFCTTSEIETVS